MKNRWNSVRGLPHSIHTMQDHQRHDVPRLHVYSSIVSSHNKTRVHEPVVWLYLRLTRNALFVLILASETITLASNHGIKPKAAHSGGLI